MRVCLCSAAASSKGKKGAVASGGNLTTAAPIPGFRLQWPQKMVPALNPINYRYITGVDRLPPCPRVSMMQFVVAFSCGCSKLLSVFFFFFFFQKASKPDKSISLPCHHNSSSLPINANHLPFRCSFCYCLRWQSCQPLLHCVGRSAGITLRLCVSSSLTFSLGWLPWQATFSQLPQLQTYKTIQIAQPHRALF